ncbi:MAG TPA: polymer-forming cytoskeletal protein [Steroidobacteraceae bacterium]|jgi:cytoskeletal protein CcmA (bactofilin family)
MFTRDARQPRIDTLIGKSARVRGDVEYTGGLHLDGQIIGDVRADDASDSSLSVSESGSVEGTVQASNVILYGQVKGDIRALERVVLGASARVEGDVYYGVIEMTVGAQIMGKLVRVAPQVGPGQPQGAGRP